MIKFLGGNVIIRNEVRKMFKHAKEIKCAVAFWGAGAMSLFDSVNAKKIEIICNLTTGGTNPSEIEKLGNKLKKTGGLVKMKNDLHAKVYWTENGVIIGSANASSNGLALEGDEILGWKETAIMSTDLKIISATRKWLLDIWESAEVINKKGFIRV